MRWIPSLKKGVDFVDDETIRLYGEYLETETMLPYDLIEQYVADFAQHEKVRRHFAMWKTNKGYDLPFD